MNQDLINAKAAFVAGTETNSDDKLAILARPIAHMAKAWQDIKGVVAVSKTPTCKASAFDRAAKYMIK